MKIYEEIKRISKHYTIPPSEVGFQGDDGMIYTLKLENRSIAMNVISIG